MQTSEEKKTMKVLHRKVVWPGSYFFAKTFVTIFLNSTSNSCTISAFISAFHSAFNSFQNRSLAAAFFLPSLGLETEDP
jgi:hypothetical protein